MKMNGTTVKLFLVVVVIIAVVALTFNAVWPSTYSGDNLTFSVGGGPVSIENSSDQSVPAQFIGIGTRTFRVSSTIEGVSGSSTRENSAGNATQLFEFDLPPGTSEFTIERGTNVSFVAATPTTLEATVKPMSDSTRSTALMVAAAVILAALFYASYITDHQWMRIIRGKEAPVIEVEPISTDDTQGQGRAARSYGDNRTKT